MSGTVKWGLRCKNCGVNAEITGEGCSDILVEGLLKKASTLADLTFRFSDYQVRDIFLTIGDVRVPIAFFADHKDHTIVQVDENGRSPGDVFEKAIW